jgi:hypothetical protein
MSLAQKIRDAMRGLGGPATLVEIADRVDDDGPALKNRISKQVASGEAHGWCSVDRSTSPFKYTLLETRARKPATDRTPAASAGAASCPQVAATSPAPGPGTDAEWSQRIEHERGPLPSVEAPSRGSSVAIDRAIVLRLCALALWPDELSAADRRTIAQTIKVAA